MKAIFLILRALPLLILLGAGSLVIWAGLQPPPPLPPPEIPPELLAKAYAPMPPKPPPPAPPAGGALAGTIEAPEEVWLGEPIEIALSVTNTGSVTLNKIVLWIHLPEETHTRQLSTLVRFTKNRLEPGETFRRTELLISKVPGTLELKARIRSVEGVEASAQTTVRLPTAVLIIEPAPSAEAGKACFEIANVGGAPARDVFVRLAPSNQPTQWWPNLSSGDRRTVCFVTPTASSNSISFLEASATATDVARLPLDTSAPK